MILGRLWPARTGSDIIFCSVLTSPAASPHTAKDYVDTDPSGRRGLAITTIQQGAEPSTFIGWFQAWDPKMWDIDPLDKIRNRF